MRPDFSLNSSPVSSINSSRDIMYNSMSCAIINTESIGIHNIQYTTCTVFDFTVDEGKE